MAKKIFFFLRALFALIFSFLPTRILEPVWRFVGKCISNAENSRFSWNGEERLIARFITAHGEKPLTAYDIGANIGKWSAEFLKRKPDAHVFAFEMIPAFATEAERRLKPYRNAKIFNTPLSDSVAEIEAFQHGGGAAVSGNPYHPKEAKKHNVKTVTGDAFVKSENLPAPDFIKIDVDGHELKVLNGLKETIRAARPFVQFEYSFYYVHERAFLKDMFAYFEELDYELYQLFPTKLVKRTYKPALENFWTVNYLARPREKALF